MDKLYDSKAHEQAITSLWEESNTYGFTYDTREVYSIDTPPPTVSGTLHIGHIFSYTQTDLIARYKRMRGFSVYYPMGFDDNGLPTERFVEKKHGIKGHLLKRSDFIELCIKETIAVEKTFEKLWRTMGLSIDWEQLYSTISSDARRISQYSFIELFKKNKAFRQAEPSLYCTTCRTSVAQAELDSATLPSTFNQIIFTTEDQQKLVVATTRPEFLPGCVALFFHPDDERYQALKHKTARLPYFQREVPILADEKVDQAKGSGLVMCCPFGDQTDIYWYKKHKLPFIAIVGLDGKWSAEAGPLEGLSVHDARKKMLELLEQDKSLIAQEKIEHHVNTHERCKQEIEYVIIWQWFISILDHKQEFLALADKINWKPAYMKTRYQDWVENLSWNWCISRQRFFGIPFPVWHCKNCSEVLCADVKDLPIDPQEKPYPGKECTRCHSTEIIPDTDVMDTWNTSSLTPQINCSWPENNKPGITMPMSMRPQAHDIIRTWAFDTIVKSYFHHGTIPWKDIVISGHVLAGKEKISKSKENSKQSPEALLEQYPADAIRYWTASATLGVDTAFSDNQLKMGQRLLTKLWNAFRFIQEHLQEYQLPAEKPVRSGIHGWIMEEAAQVVRDYIKAFDQYEYSAALERAERFFWQAWCDNYLELVKDQLFNPEKYSADERAQLLVTLYEGGFLLLQLFAPFVPFITETIYQSLYRCHEHAASLHITQLTPERFSQEYKKDHQVGQLLLEIVALVRKLKSEQHLSLKSSINLLYIHTDIKTAEQLQAQKILLQGVTHAQEIIITQDREEKNYLVQEDNQLIAHVLLNKGLS